MAEKLFKNARFGKCYRTRNNRRAILWFADVRDEVPTYYFILECFDTRDICNIQTYEDGTNCMNRKGEPKSDWYDKYHELDIVREEGLWDKCKYFISLILSNI